MQTIQVQPQWDEAIRLRVVERPTDEVQRHKPDVRQDEQDGQRVLVFKGGMVVADMHWENARSLGRALCAAAERATRDSQRILVFHNLREIADLHREYARELGESLQRVADQAEAEHWVQCERKLGRPIELRRFMGIPVLDTPEQMERLGGS